MGDISFSKFSSQHKNLSSCPTIMKVQSSNFKIANEIKLDFETPQPRKHSFLSDSFKSEYKKSSTSFVRLSKTFLNPEVVKFVTKSKYIGQWNNLGMTGKGIYQFPLGVIYDGEFNKNNEFHGKGMMVYPNGSRIEGLWNNGKLVSATVSTEQYVYEDNYCQMPDRRFQIEREKELQPAYQENLTNNVPTRVIPEECYDCGQGFYHPNKRVIISYIDKNVVKPIEESDYCLGEERLRNLSPSDTHMIRFLLSRLDESDIISLPDTRREIWIKQFCRKAWDEATGYVPDLYEIWTAGSRKYDLEEHKLMFKRKSPSELSESSVFTAYYQQLLLPLYKNSIKGTRGKPSLHSNKMVTLNLKPTTHTEEIQEHIFDLFYKRRKSRKSNSGFLDKRFTHSKLTIPKVLM